jgi:predicted component of type VI protein secretion system
MGVLQGFERRLEGAVEGFFARAFKSGLQPIELAKAIQRYISDHQHVTAEGVVVPNVFVIQVNAKDHDRLSAFGASLPRELGQVVVGTSQERGWILRGPVKVRITTDERVRVGRYRMQGRIESVDATPSGDGAARTSGDGRHAATGGSRDVAAGAAAAVAHEAAASGAPDGSDDVLDRTQVVTTAKPTQLHLVVREGATPGTATPVTGTRVTIGRQRSSDLALEDSTVSREHAALVRRGDAWWVIDLGSTNGTRVNGTAAAEQPVSPGDRIEFGGVTVELSEA